MPLAALLVAVLLLTATPASAAPAWQWPLGGAPTVSRPFAPGPTPYSPGHRGADLPGAPGAAVLAAGAGSVSFAGLLAGRGVVVVVHGALRTTYEPVSPGVRVGASVEAGDPLGTLDPGHEGCPTAACLHWGLRRGQEYLDPVRLVEPGPVRLLPRGAAGSSPAAGTDGATDLLVPRPPPAVSGGPAVRQGPPVPPGPPAGARPATVAGPAPVRMLPNRAPAPAPPPQGRDGPAAAALLGGAALALALSRLGRAR